jgi:hypothetical protein
MKRLGYTFMLVGFLGIILGWAYHWHQPSGSGDGSIGIYIEPSDHFIDRITVSYIVIGGGIILLCLGEYIRGTGAHKK